MTLLDACDYYGDGYANSSSNYPLLLNLVDNSLFMSATEL